MNIYDLRTRYLWMKNCLYLENKLIAKEALILKMVLCDRSTMDKTFTDITLILTPLEFEYENLLSR